MRKIDDWLCEKYQKAADKIQDAIGKNCFWCAFVCILLKFFNDALRVYLGQRPMADFAISAMGFLSYLYGVEYLESIVSHNSMFANPIRHHPAGIFVRMLFAVLLGFGLPVSFLALIVGIFNLKMFLGDVGMILFTSFFYFMSCTPRQTKGDWLTNLIGKTAHALFGKLIPSHA